MAGTPRNPFGLADNCRAIAYFELSKSIQLGKRFYILFLLTGFCAARTAAQVINRYNSFHYNVNEGMLQSTLSDIAIDKNNFCWISYPNGIQQFDGNSFRTVAIQPGLPDDKFVTFLRCSNGDLLLSHSKGISRYDADNNRFTEVYKKNPALQRHLLILGEDDKIIYLYDETGTITALQSGSYSPASSIRTGMPSYTYNTENLPRISDNIVDHTISWWMGNTICLWDLKNKKLLHQTPPVPGRSAFLLHLLPGKKVLYNNYIQHDALQCWDFATGTNKTLPVTGKDKDQDISRFNILRWQEKYIISINNHLYETDSTLLVLKSEIVNFQNQPVAGKLGIANMIEDNLGNLYVQTITGGICKVIRNNYPVKYYGSPVKEENAVIGMLPDKKNNRILVGTSGAGLFVFDTLQQLIHHIPKLPGSKLTFGVNAIVKDNNNDYLLFVVGQKSIWKLRNHLSSFAQQPITFADTPTHPIDYFGSTLWRQGNEAIVQSMAQLFRTDLTTAKTTAYRLTGEYTLGRLWYHGKVIAHENDQLIFLDGRSLREIKKVPFPNTAGVRCFATEANGNILLGTNKGIFRTDSSGKLLHQWNREKGLPDECIYAIAVDKSGNLWCSSNKGIFRISPDNKILHLTREDGLQENEFNTGVVAVAEDGELFFGGMNGVSSFYPSAISSFDEQIKLFVTRIRVNNAEVTGEAAPWMTDRLTLSYQQNSLSFDFVAMANNNPAQYIYQYRMAGIDKEWIQNSGLQTIRYSLPPGKYTLQLYASRSFDKEAKPLKEIRIIIRPPFWKTWWFLTLAIITLLAILATLINQRNKRKYARQLQQLEQERQLKQERERISKDLHDSLGAYAHVMLYKTELLEQQAQNRSELISDLKFASRDIITSLRETVWALKKDEYTAEECLVRIRNFIQPFSRYYDHIQFTLEGEAPAGMKLHYTKALNAVRIVQEAISNSIKHASPKNVNVLSETAGSRWKITIRDDGKGFDYLAMKEMERGNGLSNIEHRAAESAFELTITAGQDKGTTISIII